MFFEVSANKFYYKRKIYETKSDNEPGLYRYKSVGRHWKNEYEYNMPIIHVDCLGVGLVSENF